MDHSFVYAKDALVYNFFFASWCCMITKRIIKKHDYNNSISLLFFSFFF